MVRPQLVAGSDTTIQYRLGDAAICALGHNRREPRLTGGTEMDWKRLIQFALLGSSEFEQYAILLVRFSIGLFFAISGANKLFVAGGTKPVYDTLVQAKVPFPRETAYFVAGVEFVCGSLLAVGFLSSPACLALLIDMTVATLTSAISTLPKGLSPLNWLDDFLYLPEVLYVLFFIWLICSGSGRFSVDSWLAGKLAACCQVSLTAVTNS
jgi:putative oxidoreductase